MQQEIPPSTHARRSYSKIALANDRIRRPKTKGVVKRSRPIGYLAMSYIVWDFLTWKVGMQK